MTPTPSTRRQLDEVHHSHCLICAQDYAGDLLLLPFWSDKDIDVGAATIAQGWDAAFGGALTELAESQEFKGKKGEAHVLTVPGRLQGVRKVALVGLGPKDKALEGYAALGKAVADIASKEKASSVGVAAPSRSRDAWTFGEHVEAVALATFEGCYVDDRFRTGDNVKNPPKLTSLELVDEPMSVDDVSPDDAYAASLEEGPQESVVSEAAERARAYAQGSSFAKDLVNAPPNILTPRTLAIAAVELAKEHATLECTIKGPVECAALGMGAYLGVAQGASSDNEAQFIHLTYKRGVPKTKLAIVGKGLTYDSGGYNLKPSAGGMIELMKFDMGGAWPVSVSRSRRRGRERVMSSS
jgi:leucyl aminopeptidase